MVAGDQLKEGTPYFLVHDIADLDVAVPLSVPRTQQKVYEVNPIASHLPHPKERLSRFVLPNVLHLELHYFPLPLRDVAAPPPQPMVVLS